MPKTPVHAQVEAAAAAWKDRCLVRDGSIFTERRLWNPANVAQLDRYYVQNLEEGEGKFWDKLKGQLAAATPQAKQLAAEMFWLLYIIVYHQAMHGDTKRLQIRRVWEWSGEPFPQSVEQMGEVLDHGVAKPGTSYNTNRWRELKFLIELTQAFKARSEPERQQLLTDPWDFGKWVDAMEESRGRQFRHVLLYLLFPEHYDPVVTVRHKRDIVESFRARYGGPPQNIGSWSRLDVDREIARIRERVTDEFRDSWLNFYEPPLRDIWRREEPERDTGPGRSGNELDQWYRATLGNVRTWAIAPGQGARMWGEFQSDRIIAIGWDWLGDLSEYESREEITKAIAAREGGNPPVSALACWQFANEMSVGDYVVAKRGRSEILGWGVIRSEYRHEPNRPEFVNVRDVEWLRLGSWLIPRERQITLKTLTDFTDYKDWLFYAWQRTHGGSLPPDSDHAAKYTIADASDGLFMGPEKLQAILDTLARRKNIILQGPPGVGKTFVARRIAYALIGHERPAQVEMIQFHQSYSYEDFVQGWRPSADARFELHDGVFHRFSHKAQADPDNTYVFIIDEINRGNLSKVFGELMMLVEADKRGEYAVPLTYSPQVRFSVPANLYLIGVMNTADRSLAMVDYALRRRFGFVSLEPAFESDAFSDLLLAAGAPADLVRRIVDRLGELNEEIRQDRNLGHGFEIGHSYFVPQDSDERLEDQWYESIVDHEIRPLLEEYWFDDRERVERLTRRLRQ
ncbi:MAG: AAA family ATPase [Gemmatimonadetes bacterium]|nr:AAA family ATPase [Gemmatimonadota bacterium]